MRAHPSPVRSLEGRVMALALASRVAVLALMAAADAALPDLATSARLQNFPCVRQSHSRDRGSAPSLQSTFLDDLAPWDSVYFVRIAKCGYETDMVNAFFPLLPAIMRYGVRFSGTQDIAHAPSLHGGNHKAKPRLVT